MSQITVDSRAKHKTSGQECYVVSIGGDMATVSYGLGKTAEVPLAVLEPVVKRRITARASR